MNSRELCSIFRLHSICSSECIRVEIYCWKSNYFAISSIFVIVQFICHGLNVFLKTIHIKCRPPYMRSRELYTHTRKCAASMCRLDVKIRFLMRRQWNKSLPGIVVCFNLRSPRHKVGKVISQQLHNAHFAQNRQHIKLALIYIQRTLMAIGWNKFGFLTIPIRRKAN